MITDLDIATAGARLREGKLTASTVLEASLDRIAARDPEIHAFATVTTDTAREDAARADAELAAGHDRGPLHGIPVAVKDLIEVAGAVTGCGALRPSDALASTDAALVRRLREAGAVIIGKLATYPFGLVGPSFDGPAPPTINPRDPARITGGSSSGSAAAVAGGLLRTAIGTDTGGSVRAPACYCGVVGLKPTRGLVSNAGIFPVAPSLDHPGTISASVAEAALTLDAITDPAHLSRGHMPAATTLERDIEGLRIAYARDWFAQDPACDPELVRILDDAVSQLTLLGARIEHPAPRICAGRGGRCGDPPRRGADGPSAAPRGSAWRLHPCGPAQPH